MPELPEVEVLVRHLAPLVRDKIIRSVMIQRERVIAPTPHDEFLARLRGARFMAVNRRGKYLQFRLRSGRREFTLLGHLGMTGRMYLLPADAALPKHTAVMLSLGREQFVFEDTRYFGRLTLDTSAVELLGPEPLGREFTAERFAAGLRHSAQPVKVKLLDQTLVAGIGNIYASEALFRARISPRKPSRRLTLNQIGRLRLAIRAALKEAIHCGSTLALNFSGSGGRDGLFYFGSNPNVIGKYEERFRVYYREGRPCLNCGTPIKRIVQAGRGTFWCPHCQRN